MDFGGLQKLSLIEYPGKLSCVLFTRGCNFRCPFCYNIGLVEESVERIPAEEVLSFLSKRKRYLDAVVFSGGEPTSQPGLPGFIRKVKDMGYLIGLETNGSDPGVLRSLIGQDLLDYVAMDVKAPLEKYDLLSGAKVDSGKIKASIDLLLSSDMDYEFATTVYPLLSREDMRGIFELIRGAEKYRIQQYLPEKTLSGSDLKPYPDSFLCELARDAASYVKSVRVVSYGLGLRC